MLAFIVETQVNTQLVVAPAVHYIDTIDQLWADKRRKPNFIKNHISNENFKNARGNKKALDIYERAKKVNLILNPSLGPRLLRKTFQSNANC